MTVEVTVSSYSSYVAFLEGYARALTAVESKWERARSWLAEVITSTRPEVRFDPKETGMGRLSVAFPQVQTPRDVSRLANEVFEMPGRLAAYRKRPVVVALDEFQAVDGFNGGSVEHALRAAAQHQREVGYVFAGSEPSLMEKMIGPRRPFYKAGPVMRLEKIPPDEFAAWIEVALHEERHQARGRARCRDRRSRRQSPLRRAATRARNLGRLRARRRAAASTSTTCTTRSAACSPSRTRCSKRSGSA